MIENLLGGLFDKEKMIYETVQSTLVDVAEELGVSDKDFFIMIRPMDEAFNHKFFICKYDEKGNPKKVREIELKEILT
jgi:hypothetical protein